MQKRLLMLLAILALAACSSRVEQAQELVKERAGEKLYLEFQNIEEFPRGVVCGDYRSSDPTRGNTRFRRFVVWEQYVALRPSPEELKIFCSDNQAQALSVVLGIGPMDIPPATLASIRVDLEQLQDALQRYRRDNYMLPSSEQGLAALVSAASSAPQPRNFPAGGYLAKLPEDPWGHPYHYETVGLGGGVSQEFRLFTLGADNAPGGAGENADIGLDQLHFLELVGS
jgi:general secretion pathway protein G